MKKKLYFSVLLFICVIFCCSCGESVSEEELPLSARYIYGSLSDKERPVYNRLYTGAHNFKYKIGVGGLNSDEFSDLFTKFYCSGADMFYLNSDVKYMINSDGKVSECYFTYDNYKDSAQSMRTQIEEAIDKVFEGLNDSMSDAEKLKYLHDYMVDNTVYDADASDCDNVYGALIKHKTHCQGFSKSMCMFCDRLGIPSILVTGSAGGGHMWNMVELDGTWYNLDVTWDDPDHGSRSLSNYFLISDSTISATHTKDTYIKYPSAPSDYRM